MKVIKVQNCDDCPYYNSWWHNCGHNDCDCGDSILDNKIPQWCPLEDVEESK
jgi:hypothetical protein